MKKKFHPVQFLTDLCYQRFWCRKGTGQDRKLVGKLRLLHPVSEKELKIMVANYRQEQIHLILGFLFSILICLVLIGIMAWMPSGPLVIERNGHGEGEKQETVYPKGQEALDFTVQEQEYTKKELEKVFREGFTYLKKKMLLQNSSAAQIRSNLNFLTEAPGGLTAEWISGDPDLILEDGTVKNQDWDKKKRKMVTIRLILSYGDQIRSQEIHLSVRAPKLTVKDQLKKNILSIIRQTEKETRTDPEFTIPSKIEGIVLSKTQTGKQ